MTLATGTHLGVFEIIGRLGAGAMGEVYRGRDSRLGRQVAIKILFLAIVPRGLTRNRPLTVVSAWPGPQPRP